MKILFKILEYFLAGKNYPTPKYTPKKVTPNMRKRMNKGR